MTVRQRPPSASTAFNNAAPNAPNVVDWLRNDNGHAATLMRTLAEDFRSGNYTKLGEDLLNGVGHSPGIQALKGLLEMAGINLDSFSTHTTTPTIATQPASAAAIATPPAPTSPTP